MKVELNLTPSEITFLVDYLKKDTENNSHKTLIKVYEQLLEIYEYLTTEEEVKIFVNKKELIEAITECSKEESNIKKGCIWNILNKIKYELYYAKENCLNDYKSF